MERGFLLMAITETKTKYGQVHGVQKDGYTVFRGRSVRKAAGRRKTNSARRKSRRAGRAFIRRIISDASARRPSMSRTPSMEKNFISTRNSA